MDVRILYRFLTILTSGARSSVRVKSLIVSNRSSSSMDPDKFNLFEAVAVGLDFSNFFH